MSETRWWKDKTTGEVFCAVKTDDGLWHIRGLKPDRDYSLIACDANGEPLTAAPPIGEVFGSMQTKFPQPTDQQRSEVVRGIVARVRELEAAYDILAAKNLGITPTTEK